MNYIDDPRKWRLSRSGYSIRTGWSDEKKTIAKCPYSQPMDEAKYQEWIDNAERICDLHNASLEDAGKEVDGE